MDTMVESDLGAEVTAAGMAVPAEPEAGALTGGQGSTHRREGETPFLTLAGFSGPLEHLLVLAWAQKIDLSALSLHALLDQLTTAIQQAPASVPLGQKGDWVVMAAWLVQLRARLLLPADPAAQQDAATEVGQLRDRLVALRETQALAGWLERRPQLGCDVFARSHPPSRAQSPEIFGVSVETAAVVDVIEFLWASLALFDDEPLPDMANVYRPPPPPLYTVAAARERILRRLTESPDGAPLDRLLPDMPDSNEVEALSRLRRRSAWSSTFTASLELARQGDVVLAQARDFESIHVMPA
jgi:segregation and condensation protein A